MNFCKTSGGNTGKVECDISSLLIKAFILVPRTASIPKDTEDIMDFLDGKFKDDNPRLRYYPIANVKGATNNSEEYISGALGYGDPEKLRNGNSIYQFDWKFTICFAKSIIPFDNWSGGVYLVSEEGIILGKNSRDKTALVPYIPKSFFVTGANLLADGTNPQPISISANFGDKLDFVRLAQIMQINDFDIDDLKGLQDLELTAKTGVAPTSADVTVATKCAGVNLYDTYKTELTAVGNWVVVNKTTGAAVTPTSVEAQDTTKTFRLTLAAAGTYLVSLAAVLVLEAAGVSGYESNSITVTVTGS